MELTSEEIREEADILLKKKLKAIFTSEDYRLSISDFNTQADRGIDFVFEIINRPTGATKLKFNAQNKGVAQSENMKFLKTNRTGPIGFISYQLDKIRHIPYYISEIAEPVIIFICDIEKQEVYWYSIQLDQDIRSRAEDQFKKKSDSIQIYVNPDNKISLDNLKKIIEDIRQSKIEQNIDYNYRDDLSEVFSETFKRQDESSDIQAALTFAVNEFGTLTIVPRHIIAQQYPYSLSPSSRSYCTASTLFTTNSELIQYFEGLVKKKNSSIELTEDEIKIVRFLNQNLIFFIEDISGGNRKRIPIRNLLKHSICECILCEYGRMRYSSVIQSLNNPQTGDVNERKNQFISVYINYKLGLFGTAFYKLDEIIKEAYNEKKWESRYLNFYNIKRLASIIRTSYFGEDANEISRVIKSINLDQEYDKAKHHVSGDLYRCLRWIQNEHFLYRPMYRIWKLAQKITEKIGTVQRGGWTSDNSEYELTIEFAHFVSFVEHNPIFYDKFAEFQDVVHKVFEAIIASSSIAKDDVPRAKALDRYLVSKVIKYGDASKISKIFLNHRISQIDVLPIGGQLNINSFSNNFLNLAQSLIDLQQILIYNDGKINFHLKSDIRRVLQNTLLLFSYCNFSKEEIVEIFDACINVFLVNDQINWDHKYFNSFLYRVIDILEKRHLLELLELIALDTNLLDTIEIVPLYDNLKKKGWVPDNSIAFRKIMDYIILGNKREHIRNSFNSLIRIHESLPIKLQEEVSKNVLHLLKKDFDTDLYYRAVIFEVIDYSLHFDLFVDRVPIRSNEASFKEAFSGRKDDINIRLNQLIQICYKFNIDIPSRIVAPSEYYKWLFSPNNYDYEEFNPLWLVEFRVTTYAEKFKSISSIKQAVEDYLSKNNNRELSEFYFNQLI